MKAAAVMFAVAAFMGADCAAGAELEALRAQIAALAISNRISAGNVEIAVTGDQMSKLIEKANGFPVANRTVSVRSTAISGQIEPGRRNYVEFHSDPSVSGSVVIGNVVSRWNESRHALEVSVEAQATEAHVKWMKLSMASWHRVEARKTETAGLELVFHPAESAWVDAQLWLRSPKQISVTLKTGDLGIPVSFPLPTDKRLAQIRSAEPLRLSGNMIIGSQRRTWGIILTPIGTRVDGDGIIAIGRVETLSRSKRCPEQESTGEPRAFANLRAGHGLLSPSNGRRAGVSRAATHGENTVGYSGPTGCIRAPIAQRQAALANSPLNACGQT